MANAQKEATSRGSQLLVWVAVTAALIASAAGLLQARRLETRLAEIDGRVGQVSSKLDGFVAKMDAIVAQAQARRGPDPNRVYRVNTAGAPSRGGAGAVITIAEFSDFQ